MDPALPAVQAALVALWSAALPGIPVYDDDPASAALDYQYVLVGDDEDSDSETASTFEQVWADLACSSKHERGSIPCVAVASTGDNDTTTVRSQAFALVQLCEAALRADRTLGGLVMTAALVSGSAHLATEQGALAAVQIEITYMAQV